MSTETYYPQDVIDFIYGYLICALWSSHDQRKEEEVVHHPKVKTYFWPEQFTLESRAEPDDSR